MSDVYTEVVVVLGICSSIAEFWKEGHLDARMLDTVLAAVHYPCLARL